MGKAKTKNIIPHKKPVIRQLLNLRQISPAAFYTILMLFTAEFIVIVIAPIIIPDYCYLRLYLPDASKENSVEFVHGEDAFMVFDENTGWCNKPNSGVGKWKLDEYGSRSTHEISRQKGTRTRLLFLGSSLINGGTHVSIEETVSAQLEDSTTEALNFGTMLYSVDQMYLSYRHRYSDFDPDIVIVGISDDPGSGLDNIYIPFRRRSESNMPYMKPRFELNNGDLQLIQMPSLESYSEAMQNSEMIDYLEDRDACITNFNRYKRFQLLPISGLIYKAFSKAGNFTRLAKKDRQNVDLTVAILHRLKDEVMADSAELIVLMLPASKAVFPGSIRGRLPDQYGNLIERLREKGFDPVDPRPAFRASKLPPYKIYFGDACHYSPEGNRLIAVELGKKLETIGH